jgi:hypothetical protein
MPIFAVTPSENTAKIRFLAVSPSSSGGLISYLNRPAPSCVAFLVILESVI